MSRGVVGGLARLFVLLPLAMVLCLLNAVCMQTADFIRWAKSKGMP